MQKVGGLDEMFLAYDTATTTANMGGLAILTEGADPEAGKEAFMVRRIAERLDYLPSFRWRLQRMPLVGRRYWLEVDRVDVHAHVSTIRLPAPGTDAELAAEVSRIMALPLDRRRPMWHLFVIEGLSDNRFAQLLKLSHGAGDGTALARVFDVLSDEPTQPLVYDPPPRVAEPAGGPPELAARAYLDALAAPARGARFGAHVARWLAGRAREDGLATLPAAMARTMPGEFGKPMAKVANALRRSPTEQSPVAPRIPTLRPPKTVFNGQLSSRFHFDFTTLPLAEVRAAGRGAGGTINDAVLATCSAALRRYLKEHDSLPDEPLIATTPISFRTGDEAEPWANHVYTLFVPLPTHIEDPIERLHWAHRSATAAKDNWQASLGPMAREWMDFVPGQNLATIMSTLIRLPDGAPGMPFNLSISNVKGPRHPRHYGGAEMTGFWPVPFLMPTVGIMIVLMSYCDQLSLAVGACPDLVPDVESLPGLVHDALRELQAAEEVAAAPVATRPQPPVDVTSPVASSAALDAEPSKQKAWPSGSSSTVTAGSG